MSSYTSNMSQIGGGSGSKTFAQGDAEKNIKTTNFRNFQYPGSKTKESTYSALDKLK